MVAFLTQHKVTLKADTLRKFPNQPEITVASIVRKHIKLPLFLFKY